MVAGEAAELIERFQNILRRVFDRFCDAGRLQRETKPQQVARIRKRNRIDPITLPRLHRDQMLALEPQQCLAHRLAAHCIALGQLLLPHIIAGERGGRSEYQSAGFRRRLSRKSIAYFPAGGTNLAVVKYHVK